MGSSPERVLNQTEVVTQQAPTREGVTMEVGILGWTDRPDNFSTFTIKNLSQIAGGRHVHGSSHIMLFFGKYTALFFRKE